jgi:hypothetical protein
MIIFILHVGYAWQCITSSGACVPVPYEAVAHMVQFGVLELLVELGGYKFYKRKTRKNKDDADGR